MRSKGWPPTDAQQQGGSIRGRCSSFVVVDGVDWRHGAEHMWDGHRIGVSEANEAVADIDAVWFDLDPHSRSGKGVRVIGYSHTRQAVLTIILVHREGETGYWGANGWESNSSDRRRYEQGE
jgi:hypothetical protein